VTSTAVPQPLPAEVRQQLLTIASDVIGRRPPAELPPGVRRFARFTPAKRLRMGAAEIAAALAADESFREAIAEVVRVASPELVDQVVAGDPPQTADPVDIAVVLYLLRPPGWESSLTGIAAALQDDAARHSSANDSGRDAAERDRLAEANTELLRARDAARQTLKAVQSEHGRELTKLRHQLRTVQGELRAALRSAEQAESRAEAAAAEQRRRASQDSAELRRARNRIAALEAERDSARRTSRAERDHDEARIWLLLEQVTAAAAGLRRELDIATPSVLPADSVASAEPAGSARPSVLDGSLLDRTLDGAHVHLIVDGYNLTKSAYPELPLADQRARLVSSLGALAARTRIEVTVVFDGTAAPTGAAASLPTPRGVRVLFSAPGQLADDLIRRLLAADATGRTVVVASTDQAVAASARARGAWSTPAAALLGRLDRS
jgi:predicted RNA-binding protein with PIN domain